MQEHLFYDQLQSALASATTLHEAEKIINQEITTVSATHTVGFVVGKVTPTSDTESRLSNLQILEKRTREIGLKEQQNNIAVFSSSVVPVFIENSTKAEEFYVFWENIVQKYANILYTTPGFELSKGASNEITLAKQMGKVIKSYEEVLPQSTVKI